jgi:hypothetical protein
VYGSYLFGLRSKLTTDSTFMVDLPYIPFGDETDGYVFPPTDGAPGLYSRLSSPVISRGFELQKGSLVMHPGGGIKFSLSRP